MKIIDLLVKISKGEEVPKKIKHGATVFILDYFSTENKEAQYISENYKKVLLEGLSTTMCLNDEVEVIEEEKEIEKLPLPSFEKFKNMTPAQRYKVTAIEYDKLNEIIDVINDMRDKE